MASARAPPPRVGSRAAPRAALGPEGDLRRISKFLAFFEPFAERRCGHKEGSQCVAALTFITQWAASRAPLGSTWYDFLFGCGALQTQYNVQALLTDFVSDASRGVRLEESLEGADDAPAADDRYVALPGPPRDWTSVKRMLRVIRDLVHFLCADGVLAVEHLNGFDATHAQALALATHSFERTLQREGRRAKRQREQDVMDSKVHEALAKQLVCACSRAHASRTGQSPSRGQGVALR
jgi:hypothetical protein